MLKKYTKGIYCLESDKVLDHGTKVQVATRRGKKLDVLVWKHLKSVNGKHYHSYVRQDGFCSREKHLRNAERFKQRAEKKALLSNDAYEKSLKYRDFLSLGEPIKVGHHSEKRHRKIIEDNSRNMEKSVALDREANELNDRALGAEDAAEKIFMDSPDCLPRLHKKLQLLEGQKEVVRQARKQGDTPPYFSVNLNANIRAVKKKLKIAVDVWSIDPEIHGVVSYE
ncbi:DUF3560 domain-containing protein [Kiloniella litopenaei]|uniref:DUF3560 domain-containing protein n=1 Tax=Kiloniella litopenaei TaxID=1549748 RepID=UPI0006985AD2|nr:DUF3560 domain-containing protein [Kiloniella litopenaei]